MIKIEFSEEDKAALDWGRREHAHPFVRQKMEVLWLKSQGAKHKDICRYVGICSTTLTSYVREYDKGGIGSLRTLNFQRPRSDLDDHRAVLEEHFRKNPPASALVARTDVTRLTGITRSLGRIRAFLKRIGLRCRKVGAIPAKAEPVKQEEFKKKSWSRVSTRPKQASA